MIIRGTLNHKLYYAAFNKMLGQILDKFISRIYRYLFVTCAYQYPKQMTLLQWANKDMMDL